jgi:hypothetical protein
MMSKPAESRTRITGDLIVLVLLAAFIVFYCVDTILASRDILNLILVLPLSVAAFALCFAQFLIGLRESRARSPAGGQRQPRPADAPELAGQDQEASLANIARVVGLFAAYVLTLPWLGFDVGTCLFLGAFLRIHGERRLFRLISYSVGFGFLMAFFFSRMLPYPMPMLLLGAA